MFTLAGWHKLGHNNAMTATKAPTWTLADRLIKARRMTGMNVFGTAVAIRSGGNIWQVARLMRPETIGTAQRYVRWAPDGADIVSGLHDAA